MTLLEQPQFNEAPSASSVHRSHPLWGFVVYVLAVLLAFPMILITAILWAVEKQYKLVWKVATITSGIVLALGTAVAILGFMSLSSTAEILSQPTTEGGQTTYPDEPAIEVDRKADPETPPVLSSEGNVSEYSLPIESVSDSPDSILINKNLIREIARETGNVNLLDYYIHPSNPEMRKTEEMWIAEKVSASRLQFSNVKEVSRTNMKAVMDYDVMEGGETFTVRGTYFFHDGRWLVFDVEILE